MDLFKITLFLLPKPLSGINKKKTNPEVKGGKGRNEGGKFPSFYFILLYTTAPLPHISHALLFGFFCFILSAKISSPRLCCAHETIKTFLQLLCYHFITTCVVVLSVMSLLPALLSPSPLPIVLKNI